MQAGVYIIENTVTGKAYVGSAGNMPSRWKHHRTNLRRHQHHNEKLQRSWRKHGEAAFVFRPLLICAPDDLLLYEQRAIDALGTVAGGYNICPVAGSARGIKRRPFTAEHRAKLGAARAQRPKEVRTSEQRERISAAVRASFDRGDRKAKPPVTDECRRNISAALKGKKLSEEHRANISAGQKMRPPATDAARLSMSIAGRAAWARQKGD
jgi:group I intron endonuclease